MRKRQKTEDYYKKKRKANREYYEKTQLYGRRRWSETEVELLMSGKYTDRELSELVHHSMKAIQTKRRKLRNEIINRMEGGNNGI